MSSPLGTLVLAAVLSATPTPRPEPPPRPAAPPAGSEPVYAIPGIELPCVAEACSGSLVVDFELGLENAGGFDRAGVRVRVADRFYLGVGGDDDRRGLTMSGARWDLEVDDDDSQTALAGEYRAARFRLAARLEDHGAGDGDGTRTALAAALRVSPDLEILVGALDDGRRLFLDGPPLRPISRVSIGALWQRRETLEVSGRLAAGTAETPAGFELDTLELGLAAVVQARRWRLDASLSAFEGSGRFDLRETTGDVAAAYRITPHLVGRVEARERRDVDLGAIENDFRAGFTYYARRFHFARSGQAAGKTAELTRHARELGFNERRVHDLEGRRQLRERLSLAQAAGEDRERLGPLLADLHHAQIAERNVALGGFSWYSETDDLDGSELSGFEAFLAIPWPRGDGTRSLMHDEDATDFLRFTYRHFEREVSSGFATDGTSFGMDLSLNRELAVRLFWEDEAATGSQFAFETKQRGRLEIGLVYRYGI